MILQGAIFVCQTCRALVGPSLSNVSMRYSVAGCTRPRKGGIRAVPEAEENEFATQRQTECRSRLVAQSASGTQSRHQFSQLMQTLYVIIATEVLTTEPNARNSTLASHLRKRLLKRRTKRVPIKLNRQVPHPKLIKKTLDGHTKTAVGFAKDDHQARLRDDRSHTVLCFHKSFYCSTRIRRLVREVTLKRVHWTTNSGRTCEERASGVPPSQRSLRCAIADFDRRRPAARNAAVREIFRSAFHQFESPSSTALRSRETSLEIPVKLFFKDFSLFLAVNYVPFPSEDRTRSFTLHTSRIVSGT